MSALKFTAKTMSLPARALMALVILGFPLTLGYLARSFWVVPLMVPAFVLADYFGKRRTFGDSLRGKGLVKFVASGLIAQLLVVAVLFLIGRGVGAIFGGYSAAPFEAWDQRMVAILYGATVLSGLVVNWSERGKMSLNDAVDETFGDLKAEMAKIGVNLPDLDDPKDAVVITPENFFSGHHYSHYDHLYDDTRQKTLREDDAFLTEERLTQEEARLGVRFPDGLRKLYLLQNGGSVQDVFSGDAADPFEEDTMPFSGYSDLNPIEMVRTVHDSVLDYAYEDDLDQFPKGGKYLIILAQWYRETLFLDYRDGGEPRVGFVDFDKVGDHSQEDWLGYAITWPDFDSFFATLYRWEQ